MNMPELFVKSIAEQLLAKTLHGDSLLPMANLSWRRGTLVADSSRVWHSLVGKALCTIDSATIWITDSQSLLQIQALPDNVTWVTFRQRLLKT